MSNALKRKKKPTFYTKQEMRIIGRNDFEKKEMLIRLYQNHTKILS